MSEPSALDDPASTVRQRLDACRYLIGIGEVGKAIAHLSPMIERPESSEDARDLLRSIPALKPLTPDGAWPLPRVVSSRGSQRDLGYWIVPADSETTVVNFIGQAVRVDVAIYLFQSLLKRHKVNVIHVFDGTHTYYFPGIKGLGHNMRETVASLRRKCEELGTRRLICFGQSSGGYAAILYGLKLKADGVLVFSPVILPVMETPSLDRIEAAKGRRLNRRDVNLRRTLARSRKAPPITIVYGDRNETDARSARHLAGLPGVAEHPLAGVEVHGTVETTSRSGEFPMIFSALCDEIGQGRWLKRSRKGGRQSRERRGRARPRSPGVDR